MKNKLFIAAQDITFDEKDNRPCQTPQSILKVKKLIQTEDSSSKSKAETTEDQTLPVQRRSSSRMSRESTPGKSLRFNVPKRLPPMNLDQVLVEADNSDSSSDLEILDDDVVADTDNTFQEEQESKAIEEGVSSFFFSIFPLLKSILLLFEYF